MWIKALKTWLLVWNAFAKEYVTWSGLSLYPAIESRKATSNQIFIFSFLLRLNLESKQALSLQKLPIHASIIETKLRMQARNMFLRWLVEFQHNYSLCAFQRKMQLQQRFVRVQLCFELVKVNTFDSLWVMSPVTCFCEFREGNFR